MTVLRTPDSRFQQLPDFPYEPQYSGVRHPLYGELRMHYVEAGPRAGITVLLLHGEPSWSFAYRHVMRELAGRGIHCLAPDHIGFGRSDKLPQRGDYNYAQFVEWLHAFIVNLDLQRIVLVAQDWGGPIGLSTLAAMPERFVGAVLANTLLPNCEPPPKGVAGWPGEAISAWVDLASTSHDLPVGEIVSSVAVDSLPADVVAAYDAPFPDATYKAGVLVFPSLIPIAEYLPGCAENREVWHFLEGWTQPVVTAFSDSDPTTKAWETVFQQRIPGAQGQPHREIAGAGHFVQEEQGVALAEVVASLVERLG